MTYMIESRLRYIEDYVNRVARLADQAAFDVRADAQRRWCERVQQRMIGTVWATGSCHGWYLNAAGRNPVLWPASTLAFGRATRQLDPGRVPRGARRRCCFPGKRERGTGRRAQDCGGRAFMLAMTASGRPGTRGI